MQPITLLGALLCLFVLYLRYQASKGTAKKRNPKQVLRTAKVLGAALLALLALTYSLRRTEHSLTSKSAYEPSFMERVVTYFSK